MNHGFRLLIVLLLAQTPAHSEVITWTGREGRDWYNPANWNPQIVPGPTDTVEMNISSMDIPASATFGVMNLRGALVGKMTVSNIVNWTSGELYHLDMTIAPGGVLNVSGSSDKYITSGSIINSGTINWSGPFTILTGDGTGITNQAGGMMELTGGSTFSTRPASIVLTTFWNEGTIRKSDESQVNFNLVNFRNWGLIDIQGGLLGVTFQSFYQHGGETRLSGGGLLGNEFYFYAGDLTGSGSVIGNVYHYGLINVIGNPGNISISGQLTQFGSSVLDVQTGATGGHISIGGMAKINGIAKLRRPPGEEPAQGSQFELISASSVQGVFNNYTTSPDSTVGYKLRYSATNVIVGTLSKPVLVSKVVNPTTINFRAYGDPNFRYVLQVSTNLADWTDLYSTNSSSGDLDYNWLGSAAPGATFYRVNIP
ncbi:MAG: hypothetical protein JWM04_540 [Verrucomicrobiales bacterium]|jgi:hypothetical protein|nr:hypothetical protein [Verrucomicrobiales bacterium]